MLKSNFYDAFAAQDVFEYSQVSINSQGSVVDVYPSVHVYFLNEPFDQEFVTDLTLALKNLRDRLTETA